MRCLGLRGSQASHVWKTCDRAVRGTRAWGKQGLLEGVRGKVWSEKKRRGLKRQIVTSLVSKN